ncbi:hypothetical protein HHI36_004443 [Cryptolaemus montrouzieri]|uniref:DUF4774 domain-containing protein n=1 Tax=Cryptolaemus montrouzieri TaxID=559131 RepID=A0ABD2NRV2_9CUCU
MEEEQINPTDLEYPPLPSKYEKKFTDHVKTINNNALNILSLEEILKRRGKLTEKEKLTYQENMDRINEAANELTKLQKQNANEDFEFENREGLSAWFEKKNKIKLEKEANKAKEANKTNEVENNTEKQGKWWNKSVPEKEKEKEEKEKEKEEEENGGGNDTVEVNLPPDDASVAEANPVGLAVAGEGGVAQSRPIATAVVGPGGLAVARPVATAIAGVAPDQALVPIYAEGYVGGTKPKRNGSHNQKKGNSGDYLKKIISKYHN